MTVVFIIVALLVLNALCVAAEFAVIKAKEGRVRVAAEEGSRSARLLLPVLLDPERLDRYISTCQLGITVTSLVNDGIWALWKEAISASLPSSGRSKAFMSSTLKYWLASIVFPVIGFSAISDP